MSSMLRRRWKITIGILLIVACSFVFVFFLIDATDDGYVVWRTQVSEESVPIHWLFLDPDTIAIWCARDSQPDHAYIIGVDGQKLDEVVLDLGETRCVIFSGVDPSDRQRVALSYLDGDYDEAKSIVDFQTNRTVSLGKNTQSLSFHPWGNSFSPSGELLFASRTSIDGSSEKRSIGIYNTLSGELVGEIPYGPISTRHIRWRDSNTIVGFRSGEVSTYEVDSGTISTTHALELPEGKPSLSLSPDGSRVAVYDWQQQGMLEVLVYDCADGRLVSAIEHELPQEYVVLDVLWSPDGGMLAINVGLLDLAACG